MKIQYYVAATLDGYIATEDDSLDWLFPLGSTQESSYPEFIAEVGALAMGAATYEWVLRHADEVIAETGSAWPYTQPAWVFTHRSLPEVAGADVRFVRGDVAEVIDAMRAAAQGKNIWVVGGGELAGQFYDAGLLDELIVQVGSATLGRGKPLFPRQVLSPVLRLVAVQQMGAGMVELRYQITKVDGDGLAGATTGSNDMDEARGFLMAADAGIHIEDFRDINDALSACADVTGLILTENELAGNFFDLRSGLAGEVFQKFTNYQVRLAIVVPDPAIYGRRFSELAYEHRTHNLIRILPSVAAAQTWLAG